jgi:DNA polymerase-3 subunit delta'
MARAPDRDRSGTEIAEPDSIGVVGLLPWQGPAWDALMARRTHLPHALLVHGPQFIGKQHLAGLFASGLLCLEPVDGGLPCGQCRACRLMAAQSHPDLRWVVPEADEAAGEESDRPASRTRRPSRDIRIEQVRSLQDWLSVGGHQGGWKIALICPAEAMNTATANALLKTLEEPPPQTLLLLVSHRPALLLPTVRSRCQRLACAPPERAQALAWLREQGLPQAEARLDLVGGVPLQALQAEALEALAADLARVMGADEIDLAQASARLAGHPMPLLIDLMQKWLFDLLAVREGLAPRFHAAHARVLSQQAARLEVRAAFQFETALRQARALADHPLNPRLVIEDLLLQWQSIRGALS